MKTGVFLWIYRYYLALVGGLVGVLLWVGPRGEQGGIADRLHQVLATQQMAWNRGDIPQFMDAYWKDPSLTFSSGGQTTRGWQATLDRYKSKYPDRATMGTLAFDSLETYLIDTNAALTLGNWKLDRAKPARGNFSLVWKKIDGEWKIVHDHSSVLAQAN